MILCVFLSSLDFDQFYVFPSRSTILYKRLDVCFYRLRLQLLLTKRGQN